MTNKTANLPSQNQKDLFAPLLKDFIDPRHELVLLANKIDWSYFDKVFEKHYSHLAQKNLPKAIRQEMFAYSIQAFERHNIEGKN